MGSSLRLYSLGGPEQVYCEAVIRAYICLLGPMNATGGFPFLGLVVTNQTSFAGNTEVAIQDML